MYYSDLRLYLWPFYNDSHTTDHDHDEQELHAVRQMDKNYLSLSPSIKLKLRGNTGTAFWVRQVYFITIPCHQSRPRLSSCGQSGTIILVIPVSNTFTFLLKIQAISIPIWTTTMSNFDRDCICIMRTRTIHALFVHFAEPRLMLTEQNRRIETPCHW